MDPVKTIDLSAFSEPMVEVEEGGVTFRASAWDLFRAAAPVWREWGDAKDAQGQAEAAAKFPAAFKAVGLPEMSPAKAVWLARQIGQFGELVFDPKV